MDEIENQGETPEEEASDLNESKERTVPYDRFSEVYKEKKELETRITELEKKDDRAGLSDKEKQELEAKKYLEGLIEERITEREKQSQLKEEQELSQFNANRKEFLDLHPEVNAAAFDEFLEKEADKLGLKEVGIAGKVYLRLNSLDAEAVVKAKDELRKKPGFPNNEGTGTSTGYDPEKDRGKSLVQLSYEKASEFGLK